MPTPYHPGSTPTMETFGATYTYTADTDEYQHARGRQFALNAIRRMCERQGLPYAEDRVEVEEGTDADGKSVRIFLYQDPE